AQVPAPILDDGLDFLSSLAHSFVEATGFFLVGPLRGVPSRDRLEPIMQLDQLPLQRVRATNTILHLLVSSERMPQVAHQEQQVVPRFLLQHSDQLHKFVVTGTILPEPVEKVLLFLWSHGPPPLRSPAEPGNALPS